MFKMIIHITKSFSTEAEALGCYENIHKKLGTESDLHLNCQITKKFTGYSPENPDGHEVEA